VGTDLHVLEKVENAELLLTDGGEGGVAKLKSALALAVHGPQVVELLCHHKKTTHINAIWSAPPPQNDYLFCHPNSAQH
jgi:hypothetical protein